MSEQPEKSGRKGPGCFTIIIGIAALFLIAVWLGFIDPPWEITETRTTRFPGLEITTSPDDSNLGIKISVGAAPLIAQGPDPTQEPTFPANLRYIEEKRYMLRLINAERQKAGLNNVTLGENIAAQLHAEKLLQNCSSAHWSPDGLKPNMRYSLAGGYQANAENVSGRDYCIKASDRYRANASIEQEIDESMTGWMNSEGHRDNILRPHHKKVNIGIVWNRYNTVMVQHFEGDYVQYDRPPEISGNILSLAGKTRNGAGFNEEDDLGIQIYYDPPPHKLTRGQLARTYCYDGGKQIAAIRPPLRGNRYYRSDNFHQTYQPCPNPYHVPANAPAPQSVNESHEFWQQAYDASQVRPEYTIQGPWITALSWTASGSDFAAQANISRILNQYGNGVYTITVWGKIGSEEAVISDYSIFHGIVPPETYYARKPIPTPTIAPPDPNSQRAMETDHHATLTPKAPEPTSTAGPTTILTNAVLDPVSPEPTAATVLLHIPTRAMPALIPEPELFTPAPTPTPTPVYPANLRHIEEKRYMLELINAERQNAGLNAVTLGENIAAQLHAEISLENCSGSHWSPDGLKPYMRYSLAGGYQSNGENWYGNNYCIKASDGYRPNAAIEEEIRRAMQSWMNSPGHRDNILRPHHKQANIGIAWDTYNTVMIQHFEGGYVQYKRIPEISDGILSMSGTTRNGAGFNEEDDLGIQIYYDPPPHALTRAQLARTYCYDGGKIITALRDPLPEGWRYQSDTLNTTYNPCPNPYHIAADAPAPASHDEAHELWQKAYNASNQRIPQNISALWTTTSIWKTQDNGFAVEADISRILNQYGSGIYSIAVWGKINKENAVISEYSIFHGITPPDTYNPGSPMVPTMPQSTPTPAPVATAATPIPTPTPEPPALTTPTVPANSRRLAEKQYMLQLINAERQKAGLNTLTLGDNIAAQLHAETSRQNCSSSHWSPDGLKPYMRYSLAGGYQANVENISGNNYCAKASNGYPPIANIEEQINEAMKGLMNSAGHRDNILRPEHKRVNIGIAWDPYNTMIVQHFEADYVQYDRIPTISDGILSMSGTTGNEAGFRKPEDLRIQIHFDPPPHNLTRGQLARTYCYNPGRIITQIGEPLPEGWRYESNVFNRTYNPCPNPYEVSANASAPASSEESHQAWQDAYNASQLRMPQNISVLWTNASGWKTWNNSFAATADISEILNQYGSGVYTISVWAIVNEKSREISQYSIFYGITPPDTYDPARQGE